MGLSLEGFGGEFEIGKIAFDRKIENKKKKREGKEKKEKKRDLEKKKCREKSRKRGRLEARLPRYVSGYFWCSYSYSIPPFDDF